MVGESQAATRSRRKAAEMDIPPVRYSIDVPSQEVADEKINAFYRSGTPEANAAVQQELVKPARDTLRWLRHTGWEVDPSKLDDYVQQVVVGMLARTGAVPNWRTNPAFRRSTALMLARRYISQGWQSNTREKTGRSDSLDKATDIPRGGGQDSFTKIQGSAAKARRPSRGRSPRYGTLTWRRWAVTTRMR